VDARTRRATATIAVGSTPAGLVPFGGRLWVSALPARSSHRGGTLRVRSAASDFCACLDPADYDEHIWPELGIAYDGLVGYRRTAGVAGGTIVPALATTVPRPSTDGLTYAFRLRPGVRYSDGSPLHMADVRASFERMLQVNAGPVPADLYSALPGAAECARGRKPCDLSKAIVGDEASRSVTFHLLRPDPDLPHKLALPLASIVPARTARRLPTKLPPPGTGPYRVASFDAHHGMRLVRNRYFRSPSPDARPDGLTDAIAVTFAKPDPKADVASVERSGQDLVRLDTHYFEPASRSLVRRLVARDAGRLTFENQLATDYMFLNVHEPPFDDVRVRRALNYATDRGAVSALAGGPYTARPTCQILPPGEPGYRPYCPWTLHPSRAGGWVAPDVDRARSLIAASHTAGQRVVVWAAGPRADVARYFAGLLRRLGYRSSVRIVPSPDAYFPAISDSRRHVQIGVYGWIADYLSASTSIVPNFSCAALVPNSPDNNNPSQFCDRRADGLIDRALARESADPGTVAGLWRKVDRRVVNDAPVVPLVNTRTAVLLSPRTGNVQQHPFWGTLLEQVWVR
jgi:peptide/nickel transport system substrate-binding protein